MKRILLLSFASIVAITIFSQNIPEDYLKMTPDVPPDICQMNDEAKDNLQSRIAEFSDSLQAKIDRLSTEENENIEKNADEMSAGDMRNIGFSGVTAQDVKDGDNMSDADIEAMTNKMLQSKANISMNDVKGLDKLDSVGQKAWAGGLADEQMANAQASSGQNKSKQTNSKSRTELTKELRSLLEKQTVEKSKYQQKLDALQKDADLAKMQFKEKLKPLQKKLENAEDDNQKESIREQITELTEEFNNQYCQKFSSRYISIVAEYKLYLINAMPDINQEDVIQNQLTQAQTAVDEPLAKAGLNSLKEINAYVNLLLDIFKYKLN
jgi:hypothetical protein